MVPLCPPEAKQWCPKVSAPLMPSGWGWEVVVPAASEGQAYAQLRKEDHLCQGAGGYTADWGEGQ